jgi:hypothetical protein
MCTSLDFALGVLYIGYNDGHFSTELLQMIIVLRKNYMIIAIIIALQKTKFRR